MPLSIQATAHHRALSTTSPTQDLVSFLSIRMNSSGGRIDFLSQLPSPTPHVVSRATNQGTEGILIVIISKIGLQERSERVRSAGVSQVDKGWSPHRIRINHNVDLSEGRQPPLAPLIKSVSRSPTRTTAPLCQMTTFGCRCRRIPATPNICSRLPRHAPRALKIFYQCWKCSHIQNWRLNESIQM